MEIGELVEIPIPDPGEDGTCPFSHDPKKANEKNELGGIGTELGKKMEAGKGIRHESGKTRGHYEGTIELDPRKRPKKDKVVAVTIKINGEVVTLGKKNRDLPYPLTCAAHHLIPAQESLKGHPILKYMCKKGEPQDFRKGKKKTPQAVKGSKVWGNVAYNVNGSHNGVWLPGNYAVGGGTGGADVWKTKATDKRKNQVGNKNWEEALLDLAVADWDLGDDDDEEEASDALSRALGKSKKKPFMLAGKNLHISAGNPKWAYVKASMDKMGAQFHDRHEPYSKQVKNYLDKMAVAYKNMHTRSEENCKKCEKATRPEGMTKSEVGPPYGIVGRFKTGAEFFRRYLLSTRGKLGAKKKRGKTIQTAENIYTSGWVKAWFDA